MNQTLIRAMLAFVPVCLALAFSVASLSRRKTIASFFQLVGASGLMVVVGSHICEALRLFSFMQWAWKTAQATISSERNSRIHTIPNWPPDLFAPKETLDQEDKQPLEPLEITQPPLRRLSPDHTSLMHWRGSPLG